MRILTIDIDYISGHFYDLLSTLHGFREMPDHTRNKYYWERMLQDSGVIERYLEPNLHNVRFINKLFYRALFMGCDNVVFGYHHDGILYHIPENLDSKIFLVNVDHHHDLARTTNGEYEAFKLGFYSEYNWILKLENDLEYYGWIKNENSGSFTGSLPYAFQPCLKDNQEIVEGIMDVDGWDLIYVCLSPHHTPPKQWHYFWLMKESYEHLVNKVAKLETDHYEKDQTNFDTEVNE